MTRHADAPPRHKRSRPRRSRAIGAVTAVLIGVGGVATFIGVRSEAPTCLDSVHAREIVAEVLQARDLALMKRDATNLSYAAEGAVRQADQELIAEMNAQGVELKELSTRIVGEVAVRCEGKVIKVVTGIQQEAYQRCVAGKCRRVPAQERHKIELMLSGDPLSVSDIANGDAPDHSGASPSRGHS